MRDETHPVAEEPLHALRMFLRSPESPLLENDAAAAADEAVRLRQLILGATAGFPQDPAVAV